MEKQQIIIIGAQLNGFAGEILEVVNETDRYEVIGFLDNAPELQHRKLEGIPVLGPVEGCASLALPTDLFHIAIGDNVSRGRIYNQLTALGKRPVTIIHPKAVVSRHATIGQGSYVGPAAVINRAVTIGPATVVAAGSVIHQMARIGFAVSIGSGVNIAGGVAIDDFSFVGMGSCVLPDLRIGSGVLIGAATTISRNVPAGTTMMDYATKEYPKNIYRDFQPDVTEDARVFVAQPTLPEYPVLEKMFREIVDSRMLSNFSKYTQKLEVNLQRQLNVERALTFPNGTTALMLGLKALGLKGEVILPSFTFSATGHAAIWNGLQPVFADIDPQTFNIDPADVARKITARTSAIIGVHIFGNPCDIEALQRLADIHGLKLVFDAAHALGSVYRDRTVGGFGDLECFSLSGTKVVTAGEGGIATSNDAVLMERIDIGRNYGAGDDYNCQYAGLNGKMSEFHAAVAIHSLDLLPESVRQRNRLAGAYRQRLAQVPGIAFQQIPAENLSTYKDFAMVIDPPAFGMDRDALVESLKTEGIYAKKYFYPPLHRMPAYAAHRHPDPPLSVTDRVANNIVCLPIFSHMHPDTLDKICYAICRIHQQNRP